MNRRATTAALLAAPEEPAVEDDPALDEAALGAAALGGAADGAGVEGVAAAPVAEPIVPVSNEIDASAGRTRPSSCSA